MWNWDLLCYSEKGQLHIDSCLCTGLHKRYTILLRWKNIRGVSGLSAGEITTKRGLYVTFASFSPSSVFTTLSAAMSDCEMKTSHHEGGEGGRRFTVPLATVMHHHVSLHILLSGSSPASWRARAPSDWWDATSSSRRADATTDSRRQSCCSRSEWSELPLCDTFDPGEGVESSLSHQRELLDIQAMTAGCNETWKFLLSSSSALWIKWSVFMWHYFECIFP